MAGKFEAVRRGTSTKTKARRYAMGNCKERGGARVDADHDHSSCMKDET
jgi:hypothetical protein